jgi:hypothetical protein
MFNRLKEYRKELSRGRPGSRFEDSFDRQREKRTSRAGRALRIIGGLILFPVGVFFLAVPGPGLLVIALGAVLIAREFRFAARMLDATEVRARALWKWAQRLRRRLARSRRAILR